MLTVVSAALVYGLTGGLAPGPLMTLVLTQTLRYGAREGVRSALAPLITDAPIMFVLLVFLDEIATVRPLVGAIGIAGTLYLLSLAVESWRARPPQKSETAAPPRSLLRGAVVNFLNPNPYLFWLTAGTPMLLKAWQISWFAAAAFIAVFFVCLVGSKIAISLMVARSREHVVGRWYTMAMRTLAVLLVVFAALIAHDAMELLMRRAN